MAAPSPVLPCVEPMPAPIAPPASVPQAESAGIANATISAARMRFMGAPLRESGDEPVLSRKEQIAFHGVWRARDGLPLLDDGVARHFSRVRGLARLRAAF